MIVSPAPRVIDRDGVHDGATLLNRSRTVARSLLRAGACHDLSEQRVALLSISAADWVVGLWGIWMAGGMAVPLSPQHPPAEWRYMLEDADATLLIIDVAHALLVRDAVRGTRWESVPALVLGNEDVAASVAPGGDPRGHEGDHPDERAGVSLPTVAPARGALMLYTSGTTGKPKGVVHTHASLHAQVDALIAAWGWSRFDHALLVLPLHHVHGVVNATCVPLAVGAQLTMHAGFDAERVWHALVHDGITVFQAVPTIWSRLLAVYAAAPEPVQRAYRAAVRGMRLLVSGSAALPVELFTQWQAVAGQPLLERYGMTEIGMALSNPLHGVRMAGHVGMPLPHVHVRAVDEQGDSVPVGTAGELEVRGATVMREYWRRPEETARAFRDGWFRTGDIGVCEVVPSGHSWRLLGRASTDIIKTGGYKVSALEIEEAIRSMAPVRDCAVVGVPDAEWGERVAVAVEWAEGAPSVWRTDDGGALALLRAQLKDVLAVYKIPSLLRSTNALPRNAMGKIQKPVVRTLFMEGS